MLSQWSDSRLSSTYAEAKKESHDFALYKKTLKRQWVGQKADLAGLLGNIATKLKTYEMRPYNPPPGLALVVSCGPISFLQYLAHQTVRTFTQDIDRMWAELLSGEAGRSRSINANIREIKEDLRRKYGEAANACERSLQSIAIDLAALDGELEGQLVQIDNLASRISEIMTHHLPMIGSLEQDCKDAGCEESDYTVYTTDDLEFEASLVKEAVAKKKAFVNNQVSKPSTTSARQDGLAYLSLLFRSLLGQPQSSRLLSLRNSNLRSVTSTKIKRISWL